VAQFLFPDVILAAIRIDQCAGIIYGHGVNGQIASCEIFLNRNIGRGIEAEAVIAGGCFSLSSGKGILLTGLRVQKYGEILANALVTITLEIIRGGAHDAPVPFCDRYFQLLVPNSTSDKVNFHAVILAVC
jgi:hypothetical protein